MGLWTCCLTKIRRRKLGSVYCFDDVYDQVAGCCGYTTYAEYYEYENTDNRSSEKEQMLIRLKRIHKPTVLASTDHPDNESSGYLLLAEECAKELKLRYISTPSHINPSSGNSVRLLIIYPENIAVSGPVVFGEDLTVIGMATRKQRGAFCRRSTTIRLKLTG
jgi:hypothetical protein